MQIEKRIEKEKLLLSDIGENICWMLLQGNNEKVI